jgi:hypothetical protein
MSQHSAGPDRAERPILGGTQIWVGLFGALLDQVRDASCGRPTVFSQQRGDLTPAVEPAQPDLPADNQADEQDERRVLGRQRALGLHTPAEFLIQPLDHVGIRYERGAVSKVHGRETRSVKRALGGYPGIASRARRDPGGNARCVMPVELGAGCPRYGGGSRDRGSWGARRMGRPLTYDELRARVSIWPPLRLARMRCERESVGVV